MKKTIFVLPVCLLFAFCSSSRKVAEPAPGISNVTVSRGDTMTSAAKVSASYTNTDKDFAYSASHDTALNGTWMLEGMMANDGTWKSAHPADEMMNTDSAMTMMTDSMAMSSTEKSAKTKSKKTNRKALYDAANKRLSMNYKDTTAMDTTVQPFEYWKRTPTLVLSAGKMVFSGNTGCNSMSGIFHFNNTSIQFDRNIITSKMSCNEYDETAFLSALKKADSYMLNGNMLELKQGSTTLLTFKRS